MRWLCSSWRSIALLPLSSTPEAVLHECHVPSVSEPPSQLSYETIVPLFYMNLQRYMCDIWYMLSLFHTWRGTWGPLQHWCDICIRKTQYILSSIMITRMYISSPFSFNKWAHVVYGVRIHVRVIHMLFNNDVFTILSISLDLGHLTPFLTKTLNHHSS